MDYTNDVAQTRIRLYNHWFPVERGRYKKSLIPRKNRICTLGSEDIGDEIHCMLLCSFSKIQQCKKIVQRTLSHFDSI